MNTRKYIHSRHGDIEIGNTMGALLAIVLLTAGVVYVGVQLGYIKTQSSVGTDGTAGTGGCYGGYVPPPNWTCTSLKMVFAVNDPLPASSNAINSATVAIYDPSSLSVKEAPSTASDGTVTTNNQYTTGQSFVAKLSASNYVTAYYPFIVPPVASTASQVTTITVPFYMIKLGTFSVTAAVTGGTTWTSTFATYSFLNTGLNQIVATFTITETDNNEGYLSSYDIVNKVNQLFVADFNDQASATVTADGYHFFTKQGTTSHWTWVMPDGFSSITPTWANRASAISSVMAQDFTARYQQSSPSVQSLTINGATVTGSISQQLQGNTQQGGSATFAATFNKGSLGTGASMIVVLQLQYYADPVYYAAFGNFGPNVAQSGSDFKISFKN